MKLKLYYWALGVEALACMVLNGVGVTLTEDLAPRFAFPFEQIGAGLRALSAGGAAGNVGAFVLYLLLGALPIAGLVVLLRRRRFRPEDILLILLSLALYGTLYLFINPGYISVALGTTSLVPALAKAAIGAVVYSIGFGYLALHALRAFTTSGTARLMRYLMILIGLVGVGLVYVIVSRLGRFVVLLYAADSGIAANVMLTYAVDLLPLALGLALVVMGLETVQRFRHDRYSVESVEWIGRVSRLCSGSAAAIVATSVGYNVIQVYGTRGGGVAVWVNVPVFALVFVLTALVLARLAVADRRLKADHDMII